jgi:hypothetical protein
MAQEPDKQEPIPLSQARSKREGGMRVDASEDRLRQILAEVIDEKVSAKIGRLETSVNRMMDHIDAVTRGEAEDSALRVTTDQDAADLALAGVKLFQEDYYIYTTCELAELLQVRVHDVSQISKRFGLRGDSMYHKTVKTGRKSEVQKYSEPARARLQEILDAGEYLPPPKS